MGFRVGDTLECVSSDGWAFLQVGFKYEVGVVCDNYIRLKCLEADDGLLTVRSEYFSDFRLVRCAPESSEETNILSQIKAAKASADTLPELIGRLKEELNSLGYNLVELSQESLTNTGEDMTNPANWREGDYVLRNFQHWKSECPWWTRGKPYRISKSLNGVLYVEADDGDQYFIPYLAGLFVFHSRPAHN